MEILIAVIILMYFWIGVLSARLLDIYDEKNGIDHTKDHLSILERFYLILIAPCVYLAYKK